MSNESAFPRPKITGPYGEDLKVYEGLTKREYFAGLAMQGFLANSFCDTVRPLSFATREEIASLSVSQADALLKELTNE